MSVIRFDANVAIEVALKFDGGKRVQSRIPDAPDQVMFTVCGDDTIYVPLGVEEQLKQLGVRKAELISICKRQTNGVTRWEVKRISEATEPARISSVPLTTLENQLTRSIEQANQQKAQRALQAPAGLQSTQATNPSTQNTPNSTAAPVAPIAHTVISKIMASALIASIDATQEAERYAHAKGFELEFGADDIRAIAATIFIAASKQTPYSADTSNTGRATWRQ